jgi:two-component system, cell cycle response regulator
MGEMAHRPREEDDTASLGKTRQEMSALLTEVRPVERQQDAARTMYTPMLICFEGEQRGKRFQLTKIENSVGRAAGADVRIEDDLASRTHARIVYGNVIKPTETPECYIEDLGSRNGTEVNGRIVNEPVKLQERDRITIGETVLGFFLRDEGELEMEKNLIQLATRDSLTGLQNRQTFETALVHNLDRARRYSRKMSLLIVDIDRFKNVNDTYGHDVGDRALAHVARIISDSSRSTELCARWGGEEFVILLPEGDRRSALKLAERVRNAIEQSPLRTPVFTVRLTVSLGGAELLPDETAEEFFRRADQHLLLAKQMGRNKVAFDNTQMITASGQTGS